MEAFYQGLSGLDFYSFDDVVSSFEILNGSSQNMIGGQAIKKQFHKAVLGKEWTTTSYLDSDSNANVYLWSWSKSPAETMTTGNDLGSYNFTGQERLKITFNSHQ